MRCSTRRVRRRTYESIILHAAVPGLSRPEEGPEALHGGTWPGPGHDGCMQKDVAEHCDIEPATTSRLLDTLEKNGFIVRKTMEGNRRAGSILITEKGREVVEKWVGHCHEVEGSMLTGFTEEETAQFGDFLSRAYKNMSGKEAR